MWMWEECWRETYLSLRFSPNDKGFNCTVQWNKRCDCNEMCFLMYRGHDVDWNKTNSWRKVSGFDSIKQILPPIWTKENIDPMRRPLYINHGLLVLVTLWAWTKGIHDIQWHTPNTHGRKLKIDCFHNVSFTLVRSTVGTGTTMPRSKKPLQEVWSSYSSQVHFPGLPDGYLLLMSFKELPKPAEVPS